MDECESSCMVSQRLQLLPERYKQIQRLSQDRLKQSRSKKKYAGISQKKQMQAREELEKQFQQSKEKSLDSIFQEFDSIQSTLESVQNYDLLFVQYDQIAQNTLSTIQKIIDRLTAYSHVAQILSKTTVTDGCDVSVIRSDIENFRKELDVLKKYVNKIIGVGSVIKKDPYICTELMSIPGLENIVDMPECLATFFQTIGQQIATVETNVQPLIEEFYEDIEIKHDAFSSLSYVKGDEVTKLLENLKADYKYVDTTLFNEIDRTIELLTQVTRDQVNLKKYLEQAEANPELTEKLSIWPERQHELGILVEQVKQELSPRIGILQQLVVRKHDKIKSLQHSYLSAFIRSRKGRNLSVMPVLLIHKRYELLEKVSGKIETVQLMVDFLRKLSAHDLFAKAVCCPKIDRCAKSLEKLRETCNSEREKVDALDQKAKDFQDVGYCAICLKPAKLRCSCCQSTYYCSEEHQGTDWKEHKKECKEAATGPQYFLVQDRDFILKDDKGTSYEITPQGAVSPTGSLYKKSHCTDFPTYKCVRSQLHYPVYFDDSAALTLYAAEYADALKNELDSIFVVNRIYHLKQQKK